MENQGLTTRDDFENWLASMDDYLEQFFGLFPENDRSVLDYSPSSLELVEAWILKTYPNTDAMLAQTHGSIVNCIACYVGETFRKAKGGKWDIRLDDPKFAFYAMPIVVGKGDPECPLTLVTAAADRRTGNYMRVVLENS